MIAIEFFYSLAGVMFLAFGILSLFNTHKKPNARFVGGLFWIIYSCIFLFANVFSSFVIGLFVISLALIAGSGLLKRASIKDSQKNIEKREASAKEYKNWLFLPALLVPFITLAGTFILPHIPFFENKNDKLNALALGCIIASLVALVSFKERERERGGGGGTKAI